MIQFLCASVDDDDDDDDDDDFQRDKCDHRNDSPTENLTHFL